MHTHGPDILNKLSEICTRAGLRLFGVVALGPEPDFCHFSYWLANKSHAGMAFLENYQNCRADPRELLAGAKTAIVMGLNYYLGDTYSSKKQTPRIPRIAQYARLKDYHWVLRQRGAQVYQELLGLLDGNAAVHSYRVVTDSAPLLERALAVKTGQGFIGKNTCFIHPQEGSFFLLGEIITSLDLIGDLISSPSQTQGVATALPIDPTRRTAAGGCGSCQRCQVHCPTGALAQAYRLDANLCLSYWTIEHRGTIPERFWPWLAHYVFGCDICQLVCPYNRHAKIRSEDGLLKINDTPPLFDLATMTPLTYERFFAGTPATRAKREGLMRNALIALCVTNDPRLEAAMATVAEHERAPVLLDTLKQISAWQRPPKVD